MTQPIKRFWGRAEPRPFQRFANEVPLVKDATEATLYLYGPVDDWGGDWGVSATEVAAALALLPESVTTIHLRINSPGGLVFEGIAIKNLLAAHEARVVAHVDGLAASIASVIAVGCDELIMGHDSQLMIHNASGGAWGTADFLRRQAEVLDRLSSTIAGVYARKAGGEASSWLTAMAAETWYSPEEALEAGLADSVADEDADVPAAASFDLAGVRGEATEPPDEPEPEPEPEPEQPQAAAQPTEPEAPETPGLLPFQAAALRARLAVLR